MSKEKTTSFRPDRDVREKLATFKSQGWSFSWVINSAVRTFKPKAKR